MKAAQRADRQAVVAHALAKWAERVITRDDLRDRLEVGSTDVRIELAATIGRARYETCVAGSLTVAPDTEVIASSTPGVAEILAVCLGRMTKAAAAELTAMLAGGDVPDVTPDEISSAKELLEKARRQGDTKTRKGQVSLSISEG